MPNLTVMDIENQGEGGARNKPRFQKMIFMK